MLPFLRRRNRPKTAPVHELSPGGAARPLDPESREARKRISRAKTMLISCSVCPRMCGAARLEGEPGTCRAASDLIVASWSLHHGEECPISGTRGSGAVFLSGCALRCAYCQNHPVSQNGTGRNVGVDELATSMLELQDQGAHNVNLVTPTHFTPQLLEAMIRARRRGLTIPIVWNTAGYERVDTLRLLEGVVDIYLADMRYGEDSAARQYSKATEYAATNRAAVTEMHRQVGILSLDEAGIAQRGLFVRHLVLPGDYSDSRSIFEFLVRDISPRTAVSLMSQYHPAYQVMDDPVLGRRLKRAEFDAAVKALHDAGLTNAYIQEFNDEAAA